MWEHRAGQKDGSAISGNHATPRTTYIPSLENGTASSLEDSFSSLFPLFSWGRPDYAFGWSGMEGGRARIENDASVKGVSAFDAERDGAWAHFSICRL